jgi:3-oxoacyl-[acyl-carrier protein] reductase
VLNAAIRPESPILEMSYAEWRRVLDITLDGSFHLVQAFLPAMLARGRGRIITLGGITSQRGGPNRAHVGAAKGGLQGFTRALAVELARTGVTVNMVAPGSIATTRTTPTDQTRFAVQGSTAPAGRQGLPDEIAAACLYLASDLAAYVTGQTLNVNGGLVLS